MAADRLLTRSPVAFEIIKEQPAIAHIPGKINNSFTTVKRVANRVLVLFLMSGMKFNFSTNVCLSLSYSTFGVGRSMLNVHFLLFLPIPSTSMPSAFLFRYYLSPSTSFNFIAIFDIENGF